MNALASHFRPLEKISYATALAPRAPCAKHLRPRFEWLELRVLVVDTRYQRAIGDKGRANIRRMVEEFDWNLFGVLTVADIGGGLYALIDGQHRATAAFHHPAIVKVPCRIIHADEAAQARAFVRINAAVTQMSPIQMFHAGVAAGTPDYAGAAKCCAAAGVTVMRYPLTREKLKAKETLAAGTLRAMFTRHGAALLTDTLRFLARADDDGIGIVNAATVKGACEALAVRHVSPALLESLQGLDVVAAEDEAQLASLRQGGGVAKHFASAIDDFLDSQGLSRRVEPAAVRARPLRRGVGSY